MSLLTLIVTVMLAPNISFEAKAGSVGPILEQLSAQTGTKFKSTPSLARETLLVKVKDVSLADLKLKLAEALDAKWVTEAGTEYLKREQAQVQEIKNRHLNLRQQYLEAELAKLQNEVETPFDPAGLASGLQSMVFSSGEPVEDGSSRAQKRMRRSLVRQSPTSRLLNRILLACDPNQLAAIEPYERRLFVVSPTRRQGGIDPKKLSFALAEFAINQSKWRRATAGLNIPRELSYSEGIDPRGQIAIPPNLGGLLQLEVIRSDMPGLFVAELYYYRPDGRPEPLFQRWVGAPEPLLKDPSSAPNHEDPEVRISPSSQVLLDLQEARSKRNAMSISDAERTALLHPDQEDPLSFLASDCLIAIAASKQTNLVATIPDDAFQVVNTMAQNRQLQVQRVRDALMDGGVVSFTDSPGWSIVKPCDQYESSLTYTPRPILANMMASLDSQGWLNVEAYSEYAFGTQRVSPYGVGEQYLALFEPSVMTPIVRLDWDTLRLYGSLSSSQKLTLNSGRPWLVSNLSKAQKSLVDRIIYRSALNSEDILTETESSLGPRIEPTTEFVDGLPAESALSIRGKPGQALFAYGRTKTGKIKTFGPVTTYQVPWLENGTAYWMKGVVGYALHKQRKVAFRIEVGEGNWKEILLNIPEYNAALKPVPWTQLPPLYVKTIQSNIARNNASPAVRDPRVIPPR